MNDELIPEQETIITDEQLEEIAGGSPNNNTITTVNCQNTLSSVVAV